MIGMIIGLWYEILFILIWIIYSITYPIILLSLLVPLLLYPKATIYKYYFIYTSFQYILFCQDKKKEKKKKKKKETDTVDTTSTDTDGSEKSDPSIYFPGYGHPSSSTTGTTATTNTSSNDDTTTTTTSSSTSSSSSHITKKTILFIRHGESTWNYTFNKGNERSTLTFLLYFIPNLIRTILYEYYYYMTGHGMESLLYDSPLSYNGIQQAMTIQQFIQSSNLQFVTPKEEKFITILKGTTTSDSHTATTIPNDTVYMVSNLRRAITTAGIAFYTQLTTPLPPPPPTTQNDKASSSSLPPKLMIVSALQEISTNPDALCISPSSSPSSSSLSKSRMVDSSSDPIHIRRYIYGNSTSITNTGSSSNSGVLDTTYHTGNKSITSTGRQRIHEFCHLLFHNTTTSTASPLTDTTTTTTTTTPTTTTNDVSNANNYIVTGHSLWFLTFFQLLLPTTCNHIAKKKKLQNGSIIGFTLLHTTTTTRSGNSNSGDTNDTKVVDHYMIDPISLVVVHGGF